LPADQVAISDELLVRGHDRVPRNLELLRQFSARRQWLVGGKLALEDGRYQHFPYLGLDAGVFDPPHMKKCVTHVPGPVEKPKLALIGVQKKA